MFVKELISQLQVFDQDKEVEIVTVNSDNDIAIHGRISRILQRSIGDKVLATRIVCQKI